jgi:UDP-GlcNAc3NAcA epimerase
MIRIVTIIGARPQFIKAATISREILKENGIKEVIIHTGQHFDENMSKVFFEELDIPRPKYNLDINSLNHGAMTGRMLEAIEDLLIKEKADLVIVYGDTNSTLAGALAASKLHIPVAHVEAGLRSFNMKMPEEINRILTDRISTFLFSPTQEAINNLIKEGFDQMDCHVMNTGDVMYDAALYYTPKARKPVADIPEQFVLSTLHRAENTDDPDRLRNIFDALNIISDHIPVVMPVHPRTQNFLAKHNMINKNSGLVLMEPVGYLNMIYLLKNCTLVMTDSGGLQKEAYFFEKPCITLRTETEWIELIENGINKIGGHNTDIILNCFHDFMNHKINFPLNLYGDGNAAEKIVKYIKEFY